MTAYYRVLAGKKSMHANACFEGGFIGTDFGITQDVSADLDGGREAFIKKYGPIYLTSRPDKSKVATSLPAVRSTPCPAGSRSATSS